MNKFKKVRKNALNLGSVRVTDSIFTDENLDEVALIKLDHSIKAGLVDIVDGEFIAPKQEEAKTIEITDDNNLVALKDTVNEQAIIIDSLNETVNEQSIVIDSLNETIETLKSMVGYAAMNEAELAEEFTVEELTFIATKLHGLDIKSNMKEATIAKKIIEVGK